MHKQLSWQLKKISTSVMANHSNFLLWFYCLFFQETGPHTWEKSQNFIRGMNKYYTTKRTHFFIFTTYLNLFRVRDQVNGFFFPYLRECCPASTAGPRFKQTLYQKLQVSLVFSCAHFNLEARIWSSCHRKHSNH